MKKDEANAFGPQKHRGFWAWVLQLAGLWLLLTAILMGVNLYGQNHGLDGLARILTENEPKKQTLFYEQMLNYFDMTAAALVGDEDKIFWDDGYDEVIVTTPGGWEAYYTFDVISIGNNIAYVGEGERTAEMAPDSAQDTAHTILTAVEARLAEEGRNLLYYAQGPDGTVMTNMSDDKHKVNIDADGQIPGYDFYLYFDGEHLTGRYGEDTADILQSELLQDSPAYRRLVADYQADSSYFVYQPELSDVRIMLAVAEELIPVYDGELYGVSHEILRLRYLIFATAVIGGTGLVLLALAFGLRRERQQFEAPLVAWVGHVWVEIKLIAWVFLLFCLTGIALSGLRIEDLWIISGVLVVILWALYLLAMDLRGAGRSYFAHNMLASYLNLVRSKEEMLPFQEKMLNRLYTLVGTEFFLLLIAIVTCLTVVIPLIAIAAGVYLLVRYIRQYQELVADLGKICAQIELIKAGDMDSKLYLSPQADLFFAAQALNSIQEGVITATEERMHSERMKIDLVTNVSHDLKTPLTSIISYVDLLSHEDLPATAKDYVHILRQKSDRLKVLINDLFDLAKATSANLDVMPERLDFAKLLNQVGAAMAEDIEHVGLTLKMNIPQSGVYIISDGNKMHRVFENLLTNAMKYSLEGSRVYVDLLQDGDKATAVIKNTAKYEMDFDAETVLARFVRGDKARTTEGSGLGLAIAQSYTEACGGTLSVVIDGDLFKVEVTFPTTSAPSEKSEDEILAETTEATAEATDLAVPEE